MYGVRFAAYQTWVSNTYRPGTVGYGKTLSSTRRLAFVAWRVKVPLGGVANDGDEGGLVAPRNPARTRITTPSEASTRTFRAILGTRSLSPSFAARTENHVVWASSGGLASRYRL